MKLRTPFISLDKYKERLNVHVKSKEERIKTLIRNAFMRAFVRPIGFKSAEEQLEVHYRLFLTQV